MLSEATPDIARRVNALLEYLPLMDSRVAGHWEGGDRREDGSITVPWFDYDPGVLAFIRACGSHGWIEPFDWGEWLPEAERYYREPGLLTTAGVETVQKLLTVHVRRDRFVEGHLASIIEEGHIAAVLHRLRDIRERLPD